MEKTVSKVLLIGIAVWLIVPLEATGSINRHSRRMRRALHNVKQQKATDSTSSGRP